jgi:hypothetical protein
MLKSKVDTTKDEGENPRARKAYVSPTLVRYGNISQVTRSVGMMGQDDGGKGNNKSQG